MRRISLAALALVVILGLAAATQAGDEALRRRILTLSQVTGSEPTASHLKQLLSQQEETKKLIEVALRMTKETEGLSYNAAYLLALAAAEMKDLKSSEALYRVCMPQALKLHSTKKLLETYGGLIDLLFDNKKYDDCVKVCRELLELKTADGKPHIYYVAMTDRFGDTDFDRDDEYDPARRLRPYVHRLLIQTLAKQGKSDQALKMVENLIRAQDHWQERQLKGWVLREAGKYAEAARVYEDVLERVEKDATLEQDERDYYLERYRYLLSSVYIDLKKIDRASDLLQQLIAAKPDEPGYYNDLGYIWADNDMKIEESEKLIRKALDLDRERRRKAKVAPEEDHDNGAYLDSLGWVLFKQKRFKEAKEVMLEALKDKNSQHIEILDHLGEIHLALGERDEALAAWRRGLEVAGDSPREQERRAVVEKKIQKHGGK